jgi:peroxiredoxin
MNDKMKGMKRVLMPMLAMMLLAGACSSTSKEEGTSDAETLAIAEGGEDGKPLEQGKEAIKRDPAKVSVKGAISGAENSEIYFQIVESKGVKGIDTITAGPNGEYSFEYVSSIPEYYRVGTNEQNSFYLILEPGENAEINAKAQNLFKTFEIIEAPEECHRMKEMNGITGMMDSINMILQASQMNKDQGMFQNALIEYDNLSVKMNRDIKAYINKKPASLSALAALQNLNFDEEFDYYLKVVNALDGIANGNDIYDNMASQILNMRKVAVGSMAPEITLPQPNGEVISLSDFRGQYVLIDFWASWCGPCRRENPNVKKVYEKYHSKGFEILGVSLDKAMQPWLNAIGQDGLEWRHVSDLKFWQSSVVPDYQITGIPHTVLVDPNGVIVAKNLRGEALDLKLAQILGE